jgi:hypothetical protein
MNLATSSPRVPPTAERDSQILPVGQFRKIALQNQRLKLRCRARHAVRLAMNGAP